MGKWLTMVVMLVGCLVLGDDPDIVLFLPSKSIDVKLGRT
jgi:hypothetical protein